MNCITALAPTTHGKGSRMANLRDLICLFMNICHTNVLKTKPPDVAAKLFDSFCKVFVYSRIPPPFFLYFSSRRQEQNRLCFFFFFTPCPRRFRGTPTPFYRTGKFRPKSCTIPCGTKFVSKRRKQCRKTRYETDGLFFLIVFGSKLHLLFCSLFWVSYWMDLFFLHTTKKGVEGFMRPQSQRARFFDRDESAASYLF